jgi:hypothetical protein
LCMELSKEHRLSVFENRVEVKNSKAVPVTCHVGMGCEMSRIPHILDSRLTDDG